MTVPMPDESLYGIKYSVSRKCNKCGSTDWLDKEKGFIHCKTCNNRERVECLGKATQNVMLWNDGQIVIIIRWHLLEPLCLLWLL